MIAVQQSAAAHPEYRPISNHGPVAHLLDRTRLHLQHGPIDLVILAEGAGDARQRAFSAATWRFENVLSGLVDELDLLRRPVRGNSPQPNGPIARRMMVACRLHAATFVTPMAAVAGAVADEVLAAMVSAAPLTRAAVNNGGDIALHLSNDEVFDVAVATPDRIGSGGKISIPATSPIRGIATSGRGGRSLSLGIADAVTVLARSAADADVAATLIANAVDLPGHEAITRTPANTLRDDSDLGARLVVTDCAALTSDKRHEALERGAAEAQRMQDLKLIAGAALFLQGEERMV